MSIVVHHVHEVRLDVETRRMLADLVMALARPMVGVPLSPPPAAAPDAGGERVSTPPPAPTPAGSCRPAGVDDGPQCAEGGVAPEFADIAAAVLPAEVSEALGDQAPGPVVKVSEAAAPRIRTEVLAAPEPPREPRKPAPASAIPARKWTVERNAILARDYPAGVASAVIMARLNALPGPPVELGQVSVQAAALQLKRPPGFQSALRRGLVAHGEAAAPQTIEVDDAQALHWGQQRGMFADGRVDWSLLQQKQRALGAPVMIRREPARRVGGGNA